MSENTNQDVTEDAEATAILLCGAGPSGAIAPANGTERQELRDVIARAVPGISEANENAARSAISRLSIGGLTAQDSRSFVAIIEDPNQAPRLRASAATSVAVEGGERAETALLTGLRLTAADATTDATVADALRAEFVAALGRTGSEQSARALRDMAIEQPHDRHVLLAQRLVAFRTGDADAVSALPDHAAALSDSSIDASAGTVEFRRSTASEISAAKAGIIGSTYGISLSDGVCLGFECGQVPHMVLFNSAFEVAGEGFETVMRSRPLLAAVVIAKEPGSDSRGSLGRWAVQMLVMTSPVGDAVDISIYRPNGRVVAAGSAVPGARGLELTLRQRGDERAAMLIEGVINTTGIEVRARVGRELRSKRFGSVEDF